MISLRELSHLSEFLDGEHDIPQITNSELLDIYDKIPDELKYEGPIYRGFKIKEKNIHDFMLNKEFTVKPRKEDTPESWTADIEVALDFSNSTGVGAVFESNTQEKEVVFDLSSNVVQFIKKNVTILYDHTKNFITKNLIQTLIENIEWYSEREKEVMIASELDLYTFCDNIKYVTIHKNNFDKQIMDKYPDFFDKINLHDLLDYLDQDLTLGPAPKFSNHIILECDKGEVVGVYSYVE